MFELNLEETRSVNGAGQCELTITVEGKTEGHLRFTSVTTGDCDLLKAKIDSGAYQKRYASLIELGADFSYTLTEI